MSNGQKDPSDKKTKQPVSVVLKNNLFLLKLMLKASPAFVIIPAVDAVRGQLSIFFEHTVGIGYVLEAAEKGYPFEQVFWVIIVLAAAITLGMVFTAFSGDYIMEKERPKVKEKIKIMLYERASKVDLSCYDDPEFYDSQVLALSEVDNQIDKLEGLVISVLSGLTAFTSNGIYFILKDKPSILFVIVSFILGYVFNQMFIKVNYKARIERNPSERKRNYIERMFYLSDYAKELRLHPNAGKQLEEEFAQADDVIISEHKKVAAKRIWFQFLKDYGVGDFLIDGLYITYLVYKAAVLHTLNYSDAVILFNRTGSLRGCMSRFADLGPAAHENSMFID